MFASEVGRKIFLRIMFFSWAALLFPWIFPRLYGDGYFVWVILPPYLPVLMALLVYLCYNKLQGKVWKISISIVTEILLISIPTLCFWPIIFILYIFLKSENVVTSGAGVTYINWINFALTCIPIFAFPILRRWKKCETK